jgi:thioredoxin reductase (NADPH)
MEKIIIVGTGPAGLTAAIYTARATLNPLVLEGLQPGGQLTTTTEVENFPGFPEGMDGTELVTRMRAQAERFGARFLALDVTGADLGGHPLKLTLSDGQVLEGQCVIVVTGASARYMGLESERKLIGRGVSGCATCDGAFYRNQRVAVVGGGDTAMEDALFLTRFCEHVTVIHRRDQFRASKIMGERVLANPKITVAWNTVVDEVLGVEAGKVTGARLRNVATGAVSDLPVGGLFVAVGHVPNTAPFQGQLELDDKGFIVARSTRTNVAGVFAAGDVQDPTYKQAVTAAGTGCAAALEAERYLESLGQ